MDVAGKLYFSTANMLPVTFGISPGPASTPLTVGTLTLEDGGVISRSLTNGQYGQAMAAPVQVTSEFDLKTGALNGVQVSASHLTIDGSGRSSSPTLNSSQLLVGDVLQNGSLSMANLMGVASSLTSTGQWTVSAALDPNGAVIPKYVGAGGDSVLNVNHLVDTSTADLTISGGGTGAVTIADGSIQQGAKLAFNGEGLVVNGLLANHHGQLIFDDLTC